VIVFANGYRILAGGREKERKGSTKAAREGISLREGGEAKVHSISLIGRGKTPIIDLWASFLIEREGNPLHHQ